MNTDYIIHAKGVYSVINQEGAFSFVICDGDNREVTRDIKGISAESANRAELKAIIAGISSLPLDARNVTVRSSSQYALNTLSGEWSRKKNLDLFEIFDDVMSGRNLSVTWAWVRNGSGDMFNDICSDMCTKLLGYDCREEFKLFLK